jgi:hypothetical protein
VSFSHAFFCRPPRRRQSFGASVCLAACVLLGCTKTPSAPADLSKTPWLDPQVQQDGLRNSDARIRGASALNLGKIGAAAAAAIPELEKLAAEDPEPKIREIATKTLEKIRSAAD